MHSVTLQASTLPRYPIKFPGFTSLGALMLTQEASDFTKSCFSHCAVCVQILLHETRAKPPSLWLPAGAWCSGHSRYIVSMPSVKGRIEMKTCTESKLPSYRWDTQVINYQQNQDTSVHKRWHHLSDVKTPGMNQNCPGQAGIPGPPRCRALCMMVSCNIEHSQSEPVVSTHSRAF